MMLNLWRLMRSELKLSSYSLASVTAAVLRQRVPHISQQQMSSWFAGGAAGGPGGVQGSRQVSQSPEWCCCCYASC
jgi:DNA polymerase zeta